MGIDNKVVKTEIRKKYFLTNFSLDVFHFLTLRFLSKRRPFLVSEVSVNSSKVWD